MKRLFAQAGLDGGRYVGTLGRFVIEPGGTRSVRSGATVR